MAKTKKKKNYKKEHYQITLDLEGEFISHPEDIATELEEYIEKNYPELEIGISSCEEFESNEENDDEN